MKKINFEKYFGLALLLILVIGNTIIAYAGIKNPEIAKIFDTFSWGFVNALLLFLGLTQMRQADKK